MYNGIGILTPRGTGTSGYVQTNKFNLRGPPRQRPEDLRAAHDKTAHRKPDQGILDHNRRREIELKVMQMADLMEEQGYTEEDIEKETAKLRKTLEAEGTEAQQDKPATETHEIAQRKLKELERLREAWGIKEDAVEGAAFDHELQEELKQKEIAEREAKRKQREAEREAREKERKKRLKEQEKRRAKEEAAAKEAEERMRKEGEEKAKKQSEMMAQRRRERAKGELQGGKDDPAAGRKRRHEEADHNSADEAGEDRWVAGQPVEPEERWNPGAATPDLDGHEAEVNVGVEGGSEDGNGQASLPEPSVSGVLSPTPTMSRSGPPSPSPAKLRAVTKEPPPAKEPSPPRTDRPAKSPPARVRSRASQSASPPRRRSSRREDVRSRPRGRRHDEEAAGRSASHRHNGYGRNGDRDADRRYAGSRYGGGRDGDSRDGRRERPSARDTERSRRPERREARSPERAARGRPEPESRSKRARHDSLSPPRRKAAPQSSSSNSNGSDSTSSSTSSSSGSGSSSSGE